MGYLEFPVFLLVIYTSSDFLLKSYSLNWVDVYLSADVDNCIQLTGFSSGFTDICDSSQYS
jgi:hypothetical protein